MRPLWRSAAIIWRDKDEATRPTTRSSNFSPAPLLKSTCASMHSAARYAGCSYFVLCCGFHVRVGSKSEKLNESICFLLFTHQRTSPRYFGMSVSCRYCCKSRKSNDAENLAKADV